jgi:AsmA protein
MEMSPGKKRALLVIGGIVAALALAIAAVVLFVDFNRYKPRFETEASKALGLEVRIRGEMNIALFPPPGLTLAGIEVTRNGEDVLRVERMRGGLKILPLFLGRIRFRELEFVRPELSLRRTTSGPFDFERYLYRPLRNAREALPGTFDRIDGISVTEGKIS